MESGYGQFILLDEDNELDDEYKITTSIVQKNSFSKMKGHIFFNNNMRGSVLIMFLQYVCNLVEYFYKK